MKSKIILCKFCVFIGSSYFYSQKDKMGNWSERQIVKQEAKEKDKIRKENLAKYFYDLSKLSFTGLL